MDQDVDRHQKGVSDADSMQEFHLRSAISVEIDQATIMVDVASGSMTQNEGVTATRNTAFSTTRDIAAMVANVNSFTSATFQDVEVRMLVAKYMFEQCCQLRVTTQVLSLTFLLT